MNGYDLDGCEQENLFFPTNFNKDNRIKHKSRLGRKKIKHEAVTHPITPARSLVLEAKQGEALKDIANILQEPNPALNDSFISDSNSTSSDTRSANLTESFKTPGRSFYLPCINDSPLAPLQGILESPRDISHTLFFSPAVTEKKNNVHKTLFGKATDADRSFGVSCLDEKKCSVAESRVDLKYDLDSHGRIASGLQGMRSCTYPASCEPSPFGKIHSNSSLKKPLCDANNSRKYGVITPETRRGSCDSNFISEINHDSVKPFVTPQYNCENNKFKHSFDSDKHEINYLSKAPVSTPNGGEINHDSIKPFVTPQYNYENNKFKHSYDSDKLEVNCRFKTPMSTPRGGDVERECHTDMARSQSKSEQGQTRLCKTQENIPYSLSSFAPKKNEVPTFSSFLKPTIPGIDLITKNISTHFSRFASNSSEDGQTEDKNDGSLPLGKICSSLEHRVSEICIESKVSIISSTGSFKAHEPIELSLAGNRLNHKPETQKIPSSMLQLTSNHLNGHPTQTKFQENPGSCLYFKTHSVHTPKELERINNTPMKVEAVDEVDSASNCAPDDALVQAQVKGMGRVRSFSGSAIRESSSFDEMDKLNSLSHPTPVIVSSVGRPFLHQHHNRVSRIVHPTDFVGGVKSSVTPDSKNTLGLSSNPIRSSNNLYQSESKSLSSSSSSSVTSVPIDEIDSFRKRHVEEKVKPANGLFHASLLKNECSMIEGMDAPAPSRSSIFHSSIIKSVGNKEEPKNSPYPFPGNNPYIPKCPTILHSNNNNQVNSILNQDLIVRNPDSRLLTPGEKHSGHHVNQMKQRDESMFKKPHINGNEDVFKKPAGMVPRTIRENPSHPDKIYVNGIGYPVLSELGRGGSSKVFQALGEDSRLLAIKVVDLQSVDQMTANGYLNETNLLAKLQCCSSVIRTFNHEYKEQSKKLMVVMEKGDVDFANLIKSITKTKKISIPMIIYYWTEMLNCVNDIHVNGVIHSDLKPANFLLVGGRLKLIDFGIASPLQEDMTSVMKVGTTGTFNYMSPEAIVNHSDTQRGHKLSYKSDVWSLGCILYQLIYGRTPYSHVTSMWTKMQAIADPKCLPAYPSNVEIPIGLQVALRWCLNKNPKKRPTTSELLEMPYYAPPQSSNKGSSVRSDIFAHIMEVFPHCSVQLE